MKKSSLVMILALVGMVGCQHGKQVQPQKIAVSADDNMVYAPVGNDPVYSNNPLSHGNEVVILPEKPAKPAVKKLQAMVPGIHQHPNTGCRPEKLDNGEDCLFCPGDDGPVCSYQPARPAAAGPPIPDAASLPVGPLTFATVTPPHAQTTESTDDKGYHYVIDSPDKSFKCYVVSTYQPYANTYDVAAFTVTCVKPIEKAKSGDPK